MKYEELLKEINELKDENEKLKLKLKKKNNKRKPIKTTKKEIVDYWAKCEDECGLSVDWSEAHERCWRCGYEKPLQKCHIVPESLVGKDEPSNLVLLCSRCHIDAPNVESKTFMWDWIRANGTTLYDTFWSLRAQKEYEFIYGKPFYQELMDRDIVSYYDMSLFYSLKIGKSIHHFAHPWNNESTDAGILKMRLDAYDKIHPKIHKKSKNFRNKEERFNSFIYDICDIAKTYNFNLWEGRSKNRFSVTISKNVSRDKHLNISIKLDKNNIYRACFTVEWNPNNNKVKDYIIELGNKEKALEFITNEVKNFTNKYGPFKEQEFVFTNNYFIKKETI